MKGLTLHTTILLTIGISLVTFEVVGVKDVNGFRNSDVELYRLPRKTDESDTSESEEQSAEEMQDITTLMPNPETTGRAKNLKKRDDTKPKAKTTMPKPKTKMVKNITIRATKKGTTTGARVGIPPIPPQSDGTGQKVPTPSSGEDVPVV